MNSAVVIFSNENNIKVVNASQLTSECLKRNQPYKVCFAIIFKGHLQALKMQIDNFLRAFLPNGCECDHYTCCDQEELNKCLDDLCDYLKTLKRITWYELQYRGKTLYRFKKPRSSDTMPLRTVSEEGPLNIVCTSQLAETVQSYYQIHKEDIIEKNLKYYYEHKEQIRNKQKQYYSKVQAQTQAPN